jgi:mannose-6-phosphate isomerase-like protein (cupin superfamily)
MTVPGFSPTVLLRGEQSYGAVSFIENTAAPRWVGPPLHRHDFDEAFYVLEGELVVPVGDVRRAAGAGTLAFAPRGLAHTLANHSERKARYLLVCTPAGFERYFARIQAELAGEALPEWARAPLPPVVTLGPPIPMPTPG